MYRINSTGPKFTTRLGPSLRPKSILENTTTWQSLHSLTSHTGIPPSNLTSKNPRIARIKNYEAEIGPVRKYSNNLANAGENCSPEGEQNVTRSSAFATYKKLESEFYRNDRLVEEQLFPSPYGQIIDDILYNAGARAMALLYLSQHAKTPEESAQIFVIHLYGGGRATRHIQSIWQLSAQPEIAHRFKLGPYNLLTILEEDILKDWSQEIRERFERLHGKDATKFDETLGASILNKQLDNPMGVREDRKLTAEEQKNNFTKNTNPDFSLDLPDKENPGKVKTAYYDAKNFSMKGIRIYNDVRIYQENLLFNAIKAHKKQYSLLERQLPNLTGDAAQKCREFMNYLKDCLERYTETKNPEEFVKTYNNASCIFGDFMSRNNMGFTMVVKTDLEHLKISPEIRDSYKKAFTYLASHPHSPLKSILEARIAGNKKFDFREFLEEIAKKLETWEPPENGF